MNTAGLASFMSVAGFTRAHTANATRATMANRPCLISMPDGLASSSSALALDAEYTMTTPIHTSVRMAIDSTASGAMSDAPPRLRDDRDRRRMSEGAGGTWGVSPRSAGSLPGAGLSCGVSEDVAAVLVSPELVERCACRRKQHHVAIRCVGEGP